MASPRKTEPTRPESTVSRTYRAAIRIGEDYVTLEETIVLPLDATDEEVHKAVDLGWRIYQAQRDAIEAQTASIREAQPAPQPPTVRDPDAPASERQRHYIAALQEDLSWTNEQLTAFAQEHRVDLVTMTKGQASAFIDSLKKLAEERQAYITAPRSTSGADGAVAARPSDHAPASEKQIDALRRLALQHHLDLEAEVQRRFETTPGELTSGQASALLREWQRPARRAVGE
ncbi:hypothetical protein [Roseiflexus sp.]|uniref:hypothetical protein n=1 Tax=Roseiflexus sp. TaxID=2562120 RepID=UPI0021DB94DC|nr:hypothetical protein [Roseiflexus sp.]GIW01053.1 MAG: hypothetical protein KatS3mg058_2456 [Roseiflexus sp.]